MKTNSVILRTTRIYNVENPCKLDNYLPSTENEQSGIKEGRRGRPRADAVTTMMQQGSSSPSAIKCRYCNRVFPREKSLQTHVRTHTGRLLLFFENIFFLALTSLMFYICLGEKPYVCDYPGCPRAFTQSGHLKTHQRLHTGESPFKCAVFGCTARFKHANRRCVHHPTASLIREIDSSLTGFGTLVGNSVQSVEVHRWLERYIRISVYLIFSHAF